MYCSAAQAIEVLLKTKAYIVKKLAKDFEDSGRVGQVTWSKYKGPQSAWEEAKNRSGF